VRYNTIDTTVALSVAFFVNAAILVLAAVVFYGHDKVTLPSGQVIAFTPTRTGSRSPT
jgi:manganese transport protein